MAPRNKDTDVELIVVADPWAEFGPALPDHLPHNAKNFSGTFDRWHVWSVATLLTIFVHSLLLTPLLLGTPSRKSRLPLTEGAAASAQNAQANEFVSTLILLNDHSITPPGEQDDSAYAVLKVAGEPELTSAEVAISASQPQLEITGAEQSTDANASTAEATGDAAGRAMLFGRYMGQIKARIERAWIQPTAAIQSGFRCKVQIKQSKQGEVKEVTLQHCNDDPTWQLSLVHAIQSASPLPAPPNETVFTDIITLSFDADAFSFARKSQ